MLRVVSPKRLRDYAARFPTAEPSLRQWLDTVRRSECKSPAEMKLVFNDVEPVIAESGRTVYVFNIERNRHRLVAAIHFNTQAIYVLRIMSHKEYDRNRWKDEL